MQAKVNRHSKQSKATGTDAEYRKQPARQPERRPCASVGMFEFNETVEVVVHCDMTPHRQSSTSTTLCTHGTQYNDLTWG